MDDLISVIIPAYNVEKYILKCLESIIKQTYSNIEIILVDDGSTDKTAEICDEYAKKDDRIKVIHTENRGVSEARNKGLENVKGDWITFVDSDDWIEENFCEVLLKKTKDYDADIALCGYKRATANSYEIINTSGRDEVINRQKYIEKTLNPQTGYGFCHMKLIKKTIIKNIRFKKGMTVGEDALFNLMISKNIKKAIFVKVALYNYRMNLNSVVKKFDENYANKYLKSMQIIQEYMENNYENEKNIQNLNNFIAFHMLLIAVNYCFHPENKEKRKIKLLRKLCNIDEFKKGIKKSNYDNLSITRKITLFTLKHKLYLVTALICDIRQRQNRGNKENEK